MKYELYIHMNDENSEILPQLADSERWVEIVIPIDFQHFINTDGVDCLNDHLDDCTQPIILENISYTLAGCDIEKQQMHLRVNAQIEEN